MMPLWTTTMRPVQSRCGWAFSSVGRPCVAQRVWPTPYRPSTGSSRIAFSRLIELPRRSPQRDALGADERHAGGVVAAVFHAPQAVEQHRDDRLRADVSDDSAHDVCSRSFRGVLASGGAAFLRSDPALDVRLAAARDAERAGRHVLGDRRARRRRRRPCRRVTGAISCVSLPMNAPSSMTVWCFFCAVVVAGDRAGADVDVGADRRVAEVRQVIRLRARRPASSSSAPRSCRPSRPRPTTRLGPQMSKRADRRPICNPRTNDEAEVVDRHAVANLRVGDADVRLDFAGRRRCASVPR